MGATLTATEENSFLHLLCWVVEALNPWFSGSTILIPIALVSRQKKRRDGWNFICLLLAVRKLGCFSFEALFNSKKISYTTCHIESLDTYMEH